MAQLLQQAFAEAAKLPEAEQDALAALTLAEIAAEQRWQQAFDTSQDLLAQVADEALAEHRAGKTQPLALTRYEIPSAGSASLTLHYSASCTSVRRSL